MLQKGLDADLRQVFRCVSISKNMNSLWLMLSRASKDFVAFGFGYVVCCSETIHPLSLRPSLPPATAVHHRLHGCIRACVDTVASQLSRHRARICVAEQRRVRTRSRGLPKHVRGHGVHRAMFIGIITKYFEDSEVRVVLVSPCMPQCLCTRTQGPRFAAISITHEHAHA